MQFYLKRGGGVASEGSESRGGSNRKTTAMGMDDAGRKRMNDALRIFYGGDTSSSRIQVKKDRNEGGNGRARSNSITEVSELMLNDAMLDLEPIVIRIQRAFRLREAMFRTFGAEMFVDGSCQKSPHGKLLFEGAASVPRPFIIVSDTTSPAILAQFISKYWDLPQPEVLITITGGAQDFSLSLQQTLALDRGLLSAAVSAKAWLFSAGSDAGAMKMVGNAMRANKGALPLIGIFPRGVTNGREVLSHCHGGTVSYTGGAATKDGAPLNPDHTHFVLVDNGLEGGKAWGSEIRLRVGVEKFIHNSKALPIVQLCVQGGPGTVATVMATAEEGNPCLLLYDSGGAATAIWEYVEHGVLVEKFSKQASQMERIKQLHMSSSKQILTFFSLESGDDLSTAMLTAILKNSQPQQAPRHERSRRGAVLYHSPDENEHSSAAIRQACCEDSHRQGRGEDDDVDGQEQWLARMIVLAVNWNRPEIVQELLKMLGNRQHEAKWHPLDEALQRVYERERSEILQVLLELSDFSTSHVSLGRLFSTPDKSHYLQTNSALQKLLLPIHKQIFDPKNKGAKEQLALYKKFAIPFFGTVSIFLQDVVQNAVSVTHRDVFFWSVFAGADEIMRLTWQRCTRPIHNAVLGVLIARHMLKKIRYGHFHYRVLERLENIENWAVGLLDMAHDAEMADSIIALRVIDDEPYHLLDLAMHASTKKLLSHRYSDRFMSHEWVGYGGRVELDLEFSLVMLILDICCPVRYVFKTRKKVRRQESKPRDIAFDAMQRATRVLREAKERALESLAERVHEPLELLKEKVNEHARIRNAATAREWARESATHEHDSKMNDGREDSLFSSLLAFYQVPAVKFVGRAIAHLSWMIVYVVLLYLNDDSTALNDALDRGTVPALKHIETVWMIFEVCMFLDQRHAAVKQSEHKRLVSNDWWRVWLIADFDFAVCCSLRFAVYAHENSVDESNRQGVSFMFKMYQAILSVNVMVVFLLFLPFMGEWMDFTTLVIIVQQMVTDVLIWSVLFVVVLIAFSFCMLGFDRIGWYTSPDPGPNEEGLAPEFGPSGSFWSPLWAVHGQFTLEAYGAMTSSATGWVIWIYVLISSIVLVNLLVAMFADTFARVKTAAEKEFHFVRYKRIFEHKHIVHACPPPLNMPFILFYIARFHLEKFCHCLQRRKEPQPPNDDQVDGRQLMSAYLDSVHLKEADTVHCGVKELRAASANLLAGMHSNGVLEHSRAEETGQRLDKIEEQERI
ncbi:hypothetical protein AB1Y20_008623 [Prymnesium parvum]|uniref:Ion transport domain-containing protein n=2 Tax=Prymnesium parvum TaxID=97485 RepID=A0AB34IRN3_PRYPA